MARRFVAVWMAKRWEIVAGTLFMGTGIGGFFTWLDWDKLKDHPWSLVAFLVLAYFVMGVAALLMETYGAVDTETAATSSRPAAKSEGSASDPIGLILRCIDPSNIWAVDLKPAIEELQREGPRGSDRLASLLRDLCDSRSEGVVHALHVAKYLEQTPALEKALAEAASAAPVKSGPQGRFVPEIAGAGRIGWTDGTHAKVVDLAGKALDRLRAAETPKAGAKPGTSAREPEIAGAKDEAEAGTGTEIAESVLKEGKDAVEMLIRNGAGVNAKNCDGMTPLLLATGGHFIRADVVALLIERGADLDAQNNEGWTALMFSVIRDEDEQFELMVNRGADVNLQNKSGQTALILACRSCRCGPGRTKMVSLLLNQGADVNARDRWGNTPLSLAAGVHGSEDVIRLLVGRSADMNAKTNKGQTPLMCALEFGREANAKVLRELGATR